MKFKTTDLYNDLVGRRARLRGLVSLAELNLTTPDASRLRTWASETARPIEARWRKEEFGLVFLAAATVIARGEAGDGSLWPQLVEVFGCGEGKVFQGPKLLHADVRDSIEYIARKFGIRNALARDADEQRWYLTVLLQCGWTRPGITDRLAYWLAGQPTPKSVQLLLNDPELRSESFQEVFGALVRFRRGERESIPESPWLTEELHGLALSKAKADLYLGTSTGDRAGTCGVRLLAPPHRTPRFLLDVPRDLAQESGFPNLSIRAGVVQARIYRNADGTYSQDGQLEVQLADDTPAEIEFAVNTASGSMLSHEPVTLFGEEDVDLFVEIEENHYRRVLDAWTATAPVRKGVLVRVADDLLIEGGFSRPPIRGAGSIWQAVAADEIHQLRVRIGDVIWDLPDDGRPRRKWPHPVQTWLESNTPWSCGQNVSWLCSPGAPKARVSRAWLGGRPLGVELLRVREHEIHDYRLVLAAPQTLPKTWRFRLQIQLPSGERPFLAHHEAVRPHCRRLLARTPEGVIPIGRTKLMWEDLTRRVSFFPPSDPDSLDSRPWLFEGERAVAPLVPLGVDLMQRHLGLGGRLTVRSGRFNGELCGLGEPEDHVEDWGNVRSIRRCEDDADLVRIDLQPEVDFGGADAQVEMLTPKATIAPLDPGLVDFRPGRIDVLTDIALIAVAVTFRGRCVGRWAGPRTSQAIQELEAHPERFQRMILWFLTRRLPIERPDIRYTLVDMVNQQPRAGLQVLLDPDFPSNECLSGAWRQILNDAHENLSAAFMAAGCGAAALYEFINGAWAAEPSMRHPLAEVYVRLAHVDPLSAAIFLRAALQAGCHSITKDTSTDCVEMLRNWAAPQEAPIVSLAQILDVDEGLFERLLNRVAKGEVDPLAHDRRDCNELLRYCYIPQFREALARAFVRPTLRAAGISW
jgi:hypothetical protein